MSRERGTGGRRRLALGGVALALSALGAGGAQPAAAAEATWRLEQPAPPSGARFKVPLGRPGDLQCFAVDRCLMAVEGNGSVAQGLYFYDGAQWRQYTTVCGGPAATTRIAWAGPDEFWTVTTPSPPRLGGGLALCHVKGGQVVGSFSTPNESPDPFRTMSSAACRTPDDCWFGGLGSRDPSGQRVGGFHLHWDGTNLTTVYGPQGRGISDVVAADGRLYETTFIGAGAEDRDSEVSLGAPETSPQTIHRIDGTAIRNVPFSARPRPGVPTAGTELLGADAASGELWFVGGGAASGGDVPRDSSQLRPPIAVRRTGSFFQEIPLDEGPFGPTDRLVDVAVLDGQRAAWTAVQPYADRDSQTAKATVARVNDLGSVAAERLPGSGAGRGAASKIDCPAPDECWMVTTAGWLFHLTDGTTRPANSDPAFANRIDFRPNEASAQFVPDTPPADDSRLFAPPPTELPAAVAPPVAAPTKTLKSLVFKVSKPRVSKRLVLSISFTMRRSGRVQLLARRKGKVVAKSSSRLMKPGRKTIRLKLTRRRYPDALKFVVREKDGAASAGGSTPVPDDTVTTGGDTATPSGGDSPTTTGPGNDTVGTGPGNETVGTRAR